MNDRLIGYVFRNKLAHGYFDGTTHGAVNAFTGGDGLVEVSQGVLVTGGDCGEVIEEGSV